MYVRRYVKVSFFFHASQANHKLLVTHHKRITSYLWRVTSESQANMSVLPSSRPTFTDCRRGRRHGPSADGSLLLTTLISSDTAWFTPKHSKFVNPPDRFVLWLIRSCLQHHLSRTLCNPITMGVTLVKALWLVLGRCIVKVAQIWVRNTSSPLKGLCTGSGPHSNLCSLHSVTDW